MKTRLKLICHYLASSLRIFQSFETIKVDVPKCFISPRPLTFQLSNFYRMCGFASKDANNHISFFKRCRLLGFRLQKVSRVLKLHLTVLFLAITVMLATHFFDSADNPTTSSVREQGRSYCQHFTTPPLNIKLTTSISCKSNCLIHLIGMSMRIKPKPARLLRRRMPILLRIQLRLNGLMVCNMTQLVYLPTVMWKKIQAIQPHLCLTPQLMTFW